MSTPANSTPVLTLDQCKKGDSIRIVSLLPQPLFASSDPHVTLRLKELGFLPGAPLSVIGFGFLGKDPMAIKVNGTKFALRRTEAAKIAVEFI
jgi:ferrous iron transport protein A